MIGKNLLSKYRATWVSSLALLLCTWGYGMHPVQAEGSRNLYPASANGSRANLEWRTSQWVNISRE